jgi:nicotinamide-nucleotide amidase
LTEVNRQQAALPECCEKITNKIGTAPGMWFERNGKVFVSMPGVPHEMKLMMSDLIIPKLKQTFKTPKILHKVIRTIGLGESFLAERISNWEKSLPPHIKLAYLPGLGEVRLRLTGIGNSLETLQDETESLTRELNTLIGEYIYGYGDEQLEAAVGKMLLDKGLTLSIAESCTGGYLSHLVTSIPGSSIYFQGSMIPYSYEIKIAELGVKPETLNQFGAVSEETIREMANLIRLKFNTDIGIATSGIAGPGGATPEKPVGTVWIACADKDRLVSKKLQLSKDRILNIRYASMAALNLVRLFLQRDPMS